MITIKFLHQISGLPLKGKSIFIVFTDTVFGWLKPGFTDDDGIVTVRSAPGIARVYVDGELLGSQKLGGDMLASLDENGAVSWGKGNNILAEIALQQLPPETIEHDCLSEITARENGEKKQIRA